MMRSRPPFGRPWTAVAIPAALVFAAAATATPAPPAQFAPTTTAAPDTVELVRYPGRLLVRQRIRMEARVRGDDGRPRPDAPVAWRATSSSYVSLAADGRITGIRPGTVGILAIHEGDTTRFELEVLPNRLASMALWPAYGRIRTGEVLPLELDVRDADGAEIEGLLAEWEVAPAGARVDGRGRFTAERFGLYTVTARVGDRAAVATVRVAPDL